MLSQNLFRAYDIRGRVDSELTAEAVRSIGRAIGSEARERDVKQMAIARDGRLSAPRLFSALCDGLLESGMQLLDIGQAATPLLYYAAIKHCHGSGVMLTGSHNPPEYNGIKIMLAGETLYGEAIRGLYERCQKSDFVSGEAGSIQPLEVEQEYLDEVVQKVALQRPLKVVADAGNGVAGPLVVALLQRLGCEVIPLYCEVDGAFPHHHPDPNQPENLKALCRQVAESRADIGLAFDGDGDRLGVVSSRGEIIWPDRLMMLFAEELLQRHPGAEVIYDIKCSSRLGRVVSQAGGKPLMWRTGHSLLRAQLRRSGALLAGEMSGHIFFADGWYGIDDAPYAAVRLLRLIAADGREPASLFDALPRMTGTPELHVSMSEGEARALVDVLQLNRTAFSGAVLSTIDGLRADYEDGWGLVRASNTTPTLVLRFEGEDEAALKRIQGIFKEAILNVRPGLNLPF